MTSAHVITLHVITVLFPYTHWKRWSKPTKSQMWLNNYFAFLASHGGKKEFLTCKINYDFVLDFVKMFLLIELFIYLFWIVPMFRAFLGGWGLGGEVKIKLVFQISVTITDILATFLSWSTVLLYFDPIISDHPPFRGS